MKRFLVVEPDPAAAEALSQVLRELGAVHVAPDGDAALQALEDHRYDMALADEQAPGLNGLGTIVRLRRKQPDLPVVLTSAFGSIDDAVAALHAGVADYLLKPLSSDQVRLAARRCLEQARLESENDDLRAALDDRLRIDNFISSDPRMQAVFKTVQSVAPTRTTVLLTGESGTGKTLLARAIHNLSERNKGPFIEVNCGALPETLLESELFGHVRGAFTGAVKDRAGKFEAAHGGTIFLDEIGTSSLSFQIKLLRVLQDRVLERVGDTETTRVDVRVVLATNLDLKQAVREGNFREDLYYRIHVVPLEMPPLRERRGDIEPLAEHFLGRFAKETGKPVRGISPGALQQLLRCSWPGNVRQLENVIERAVVLSEGTVLESQDLPPDLTGPIPSQVGPESMVAEDAHLLPLKKALEQPEKLLIERALDYHRGNRQATAASLGINRSTLFNKMKKFGIQ